jgi:hypothetical protein
MSTVGMIKIEKRHIQLKTSEKKHTSFSFTPRVHHQLRTMTMDQFPSALKHKNSFHTMEQEYYIPSTKRARTNHLEDISSVTLVKNKCHVQQQPACWSFGAARRASLAHFMEPGVSPAKLDIIIDRGIFDSNPLETPLVTRDSTDRNHPSPTFPMIGNSNNLAISNQKIPPYQDCTSRSYQLSTNAIIHATTAINHQIELDSHSGMSITRHSTTDTEARFRFHQAEGWYEKYQELLRYNELNGNCLVPNQYPVNPSLAEVSRFNKCKRGECSQGD